MGRTKAKPMRCSAVVLCAIVASVAYSLPEAVDDIALPMNDAHFMDYVTSLIQEYAPDPVAEDPAKAVEEKLEIDAATKKALEKEEASEKKDGAGSDEAAKISIVKTAAEAKKAEEFTMKAKPHELRSKKLGNKS